MVDSRQIPTVLFRETAIVLSEGGGFTLGLSGISDLTDVVLVIDIYALDNPVHPAGHLGWWQFALLPKSNRELSGKISIDRDGAKAVVGGLTEQDRWLNPEAIAGSRWIVNAVLRQRPTNAILHLHRIPAFADGGQLELFRETRERKWETERFASAAFVPAKDGVVRIVSNNIFTRDAIGNLCFQVWSLLRQNGIGAVLYADRFELQVNDVVRPVSCLAGDLAPADTILHFFSTADRFLPAVLDMKCRARIGYYHGVTTPELLRVFDPELAAVCAAANEQVPLLQAFDRLAANSRANAARLVARFGAGSPWRVEDIRPIHPRLWSAGQGVPPAPPAVKRGLRLLTVGRIKAHKKVEDVLALFAEVLKLSPDAELAIVGGGGDKAYRDYLEWVQASDLRIPADRVAWCGSLTEEDLRQRYRWATLYVSMSEDEGFGLPLFEAMTHGLPVAAYDIPATREVLGDAGLRFAEKDFAHLARFIAEQVQSEARQAELREKSLARAGELASAMDGSGFLSLLFP